MARSIGAELLVWRNEAAIAAATDPIALDTRRCCGLLQGALLDGLRHYGFDAAFGGEEEVAANAYFTVPATPERTVGPEKPAPRLWNLYNASPAKSIRVFPLSNWTEMDVWR